MDEPYGLFHSDMIAKIISGGQTGVDRAALDIAIKLGIPHGGWVPKGRLAEDGPLADIYSVRETPSPVYAERTEKNVLDSDGTLIISHGELRGGSEYTRQMAEKHTRPWLHIDLQQTSAFQCALRIRDWLAAQAIAVLNIAGPRASKDPDIYRDTLRLLESVYYLHLSESKPRNATRERLTATPAGPIETRPGKVREAVSRLVRVLPLKDRVTIANMTASELAGLTQRLGSYIIEQFGPLTGNTPLARSCRWSAKKPIESEAAAAEVIIHETWRTLRKTHPLRRIK
jgi:hypothetical protein